MFLLHREILDKLANGLITRGVKQEAGVQIPPSPALFVDAKALNNEASVHAYNCELEVRLFITSRSQREKEVHNTI